MPIIVSCQDLFPGQRLAEAFSYRGRLMLPGGKVLTATDIEVLRRKYPQLTFKIGDSELDTAVEFEDDSKEREIAATARQKIISTVTEMHQKMAGQNASGGIDPQKARSMVADVMEFLSENPVSAALLDRNMDGENPLAEHTGTVFYLSMVLGSAVRDYVMRERQRQTAASHLSGVIAMNLLPLGLGAMFADFGMMPLAHVFAEGYELSDEDRQAIRDHPKTGADALPDNLPTGVKMIVRTHHENFNGTGYPAAMPGASLHVFTRIVRICDAYSAATGRRAYRGAKSPARAVWEMTVGPYRRLYDPVLGKVFAGLIQPFPIGAKLLLTDGTTGVVVRYNRKEPFKPTLVVAFAPDGSRLPKEQLKVLKAEDIGAGSPLRIASYAGEDLAYTHEMTAGPVSPLEPKAFMSLAEAAYP